MKSKCIKDICIKDAYESFWWGTSSWKMTQKWKMPVTNQPKLWIKTNSWLKSLGVLDKNKINFCLICERFVQQAFWDQITMPGLRRKRKRTSDGGDSGIGSSKSVSPASSTSSATARTLRRSERQAASILKKRKISNGEDDPEVAFNNNFRGRVKML